MFVIDLKYYGQAFSTRERANELIAGAVQFLAPIPPLMVTVDLEGVVAVSYSFADELIDQLERAVTDVGAGEARLTNASAPVLTVFQTVLNRRRDLLGQRRAVENSPKVLIGAA